MKKLSHNSLRWWAARLLTALAFAFGASVAQILAGASLVVNTISDADNAADGVCTLREAITSAAARSWKHVIFPDF